VIIALTASGDGLDARMDSRFGRARRFLLYNLDDGTVRTVDNDEGQRAAQGAGIQAAETIARLGVGGLVTGHCGPNAFRVLRAAGIPVFSTTAATVSEAIDAYRAGTLTRIDAPDVDGHWT